MARPIKTNCCHDACVVMTFNQFVPDGATQFVYARVTMKGN